ncbi:MAG: DUF362 domain-containing protein [Pseudomonadota bacterium]
MPEKLDRREAIQRLGKLGAAAAATVGLYGGLYGRKSAAAKKDTLQRPTHFLVPGAPDEVVVARAAGPHQTEDLVRQAVARLGGMKKFISRGEVVALKPNMSWDRPPELAANTNPEVVEAVVKLCLEAGAAKVNLVDHSINDPRRVFINCGMTAVAGKTGAALIYPASQHFKTTNLGGRRLGEWEVYTPVLEADKLINLPVAKHHGLTGLTLGMKNWIGAVGGSRGALHQDIHQTIVDLAGYFRPTLVIIDATRIMLRNGPSGGRSSDVAVKNTIIAGTDQVAVDAAAVSLFEMFPDEIGYLALAQQQGLGRIEPKAGKLIEVKV